MMLSSIFFFSCISTLAGLASADASTRYLVSFGDSYTWTGFNLSLEKPTIDNPFGNPAYPGWTMDNGANWVGDLIHDLAPNGTLSYNFARPGATVNDTLAAGISSDFIAQVANFTTNMTPAPSYAPWTGSNSAFSVYFGTNDINILYSALKSTSPNPSDYVPSANLAITSLFHQLTILADAGAARFLLFNMAPLDRAPSHLDSTGTPSPSVGAFVSAWNDALNTSAIAFTSSYKNTTITIVDAHTAFTDVLDDPAGHGAPNATCWNHDGTSCLWYDGLHPGHVIQSSLAKEADRACMSTGLYPTTPSTAQSSAAAPASSSSASDTALVQDEAEAMFNAFNSAFLTTSGSDVFYKAALNNEKPDGTWAASLDILGAEDAYERTGDPEKKTLLTNLLTTWLKNNPPPWNWDGWNDDIGWFTLALVRGYQMTGNAVFLDQAQYGFDYAFNRGWDTQYNGGGIWEEQPANAATENPPRKPGKEALSNDSLGKVACMIYQSTHDGGYLTKCQQIYNWVRSNLYDSATGQIHTGIDESGTTDNSSAVYNQGTFVDFANLVWEITGSQDAYNDAQRALDYARNNLTTKGVFSNNAGYLNTWADEMARGAGHFVRDNQLWSTYYAWMVQNAEAILTHRRADLNLTWNAWDKATPTDETLTANKFVSAMAWLQMTPAAQPDEIGGIHYLTNNATDMAVDSAGTFGNGNGVVQWGLNGGANQRWLLTPNADRSWNIVSLSTWQALDCPGGGGADGLSMIQWRPSRDANQRWCIDRLADGTYSIRNQASGKVLDGNSSSNNGAALTQATWNGGPGQRWVLR